MARTPVAETPVATDTDIVLAHVEAVRERTRVPMDTDGFTPDWKDRPSPHTRHPGAPRTALPPARLSARRAGAEAAGFTAELLAETLHLAAGPLARRWQIDWNLDDVGRARPHTAAWSRGTPSGGANHPWELYWLPAPGLPLAPGLLHYESGSHSLARLATGDLTAAVRAALAPDHGADHVPHDGADDDAGTDHDASGGYLVCTVRPWKTAFKYGAFSYHVATHDIGALLGTWTALSRAAGIPGAPRFWFDEPALNGLMGLDPAEESVHAVLPLPWWRPAPATRGPAPRAPYGGGPARPPPAEASRRTRSFTAADAVRRATVRTVPDRAPEPPPPLAAGRAAPAGLALPAARPSAADPRAVLSRRRSANGRLDPRAALTAAQLADVLAAASAEPAPGAGSPLTRLLVDVRRVEGLAPGPYHYDPVRHALVPTTPPDAPRPTPLRQGDYAMRNYAVAHAAAFLAFAWRPAPTLAALGPRAYRAAHAEAGARGQLLHLAAEAAGLGSGMALGMDARAVDRALAGEDPELRTTLCLFLGPSLPGAAFLDDRLC
ncbi:nitroreductase family protein [Streptomyces sp. NPDC087917]|uniref:nitroreductase family protein n=1 Tax=Streptomyces sp. NPDC087917 TaxID=3155060 RepID=UPI00342C4D10